MADEDKKPSGGGGNSAWTWIIIILVLLGIGEAVTGGPRGELSSNVVGDNGADSGITLQNPIAGTEGEGYIKSFFNGGDELIQKANQDIDSDISFMTKVFPKGNLEVGQRVILLEDQNIRRGVGGGVIGEQEKRSKGYLKEGPIPALSRTWWRVDFDNSPDGWVDQSYLSAKVKLFTIFNIIPIFFENLRIIALILTLILLLALAYLKYKEIMDAKLLEKKKEAVSEFEKSKKAPVFDSAPVVNKQWLEVKKYMDSSNSNDWRQAIMEADIMLDTMLTKIGYDGETVADKLKNVEESDFVTLQKAWEAHKVRNRIAHKGSEFKLDRGEAERVISLFEQVFKEFYYI